MITMQDPNVMPWGALDRYQAHYIVNIQSSDDGDGHGSVPRNRVGVFARTKLTTSGRFAAKRVESVSWEGTSHPLLDMLNQDGELGAMIAKQSVWDATIYIEQTDENVRIHGRWKDSEAFGIDQEKFAIYDRIAGHVKKSCLPPI